MMKNHKRTDLLYYSLAFFIPAGILTLFYAIIGIYPFGDKSLIFNDAYYQYLPFLNYYKNLMAGKENFFYSFELYLGNGISGLFAYYLASPFNLIYLLFPQSQTILAFHLIYLIKIAFCGLTAAIFFKYVDKLDVATLIFTTGYALCSYNITYGFCYMWIDGVIMAPVIALGIYRIFQGKSSGVYLFSLAAVIISNFYIGFILCGFSVLFAVYIFILRKDVSSKQNFHMLINYVVSSVCAGGIACVLLFPGVISISTGSSSALSNIKAYTYPLALRILEFFHLTDKLSVKAALLLCAAGICVIVGLLCFAVFAGKNSKFTRIICVVIAIVVTTLFYFYVERYVKVNEFEITTDSFKNLFFGSTPRDYIYDYVPLIFTGMVPSVFAVLYLFNPEYNRKEKWAAILVFAVLILSFTFYLPNLIWHGIQKNNSFNYRYSFIFCFFVIYFGEKSFRKRDSLSAAQILAVTMTFFGCCIYVLIRNDFNLPEEVTGIFSLLICLIFLLMGIKERKFPVSILLCASILALATSGYETIAGEASYGSPVSGILGEIDDGNSIIESIKTSDTGFYRIRNINSFLNSNDSLQFDYYGGSAFTSDGNAKSAEFCHENGIQTSTEKIVLYDGSATRALDSLLGFKYCISADGFADYETVSGTVYKNSYVLPIGFMAEKDAKIIGQLDSDNAFENLNLTWNLLAPSVGDIYIPVSAALQKPDGQTLQAEFICDGTDPLYSRVPSDNVSSVEVQVNGETYKQESKPYAHETLYLGIFEPGDVITVIWRFKEDADLDTAEDYIYRESTAKLRQATESLKSISCKTTVLSESHIVSSIMLEDSGTLVYSIPYDAGWTITVDGMKTTSYAAASAFTAVDLSAGTHEVELTYVPEGLAFGVTLTMISFTVAVAFLLLEKKRGVGEKEP